MKKLLLTVFGMLTVFFASAQCTASFTLANAATPPLSVTLTNTSTASTSLLTYTTNHIYWGDGGSTYSYINGVINHTYTSPGTYTVKLVLLTIDSATQTTICADSTTQNITVNYSPCTTTITTVNNGNGMYSFTANNIGGGTNMTYSWNFGNGTTASGANTSVTYTTSGTYTVTLVAAGSGCTYTTSITISYFNGSINCNTLAANFTTSQSGNTVTCYNSSTQANVPPASVVRVAHWSFGDGSAIVSNNNYPSHAYAAAGTYLITLTNDWVDSTNTATIYCTKTDTQSVTIAPPANIISGNIYWDSLNTWGTNYTFKVWLIVHDAVNNTLTAVDSTTTSGVGMASYSFNNEPAGAYLTKAAVLSGNPTATVGLVPTYHDSSLYWSGATTINHTGGSSLNENIHMISGTTTNGPGFVGGNISAGANKGTNSGVPNLLVFLRNASNQLVAFTYTDINGDFSFGNLPVSTYNVYPEAMNYVTIPSSQLIMNATQYTLTGVNFVKTSTQIKPVNTGVTNLTTSNFYSVYPNPTNGAMTINWGTNASGIANIQITDVIGRVVLQTTAITNQSTKLNIANIKSGVYLIKITTDKMQQTEKVIVE